MSNATEVVLADIRDTPLSVDELVAAVRDRRAGAVVTFQNQVSDNQVKVLVYNVQTTTAVTTNINNELLVARGTRGQV